MYSSYIKGAQPYACGSQLWPAKDFDATVENFDESFFSS